MEVKITCWYCDHTVYKTVYDQRGLQDLTCIICKDPNLIIKDVAKDRLDTYAGSPPFEDKKDSDKFENESIKAPYWNWGGD